MGLSGVLHVEVEVKSPAEKFWVALGDGINLFPKEFPKDYKTMQVLAGDGNSPGSIRLIIYGEGILSHFIVNLLPYIVSYSDVTREGPRMSNEYGITFMKIFFLSQHVQTKYFNKRIIHVSWLAKSSHFLIKLFYPFIVY